MCPSVDRFHVPSCTWEWRLDTPRAVSARDRWTDAQRALGWAIVAVGAALRLREYLANRSLWRDEAMLVFNLRHRDALGFTTPLDHNQGTPPGFFVVDQAVGSLGGQSELAYRFVPFVAAIGVLILAMVLVRRHLEPVAGLVALALVALSSALVYFAAEVKSYELDVLVHSPPGSRSRWPSSGTWTTEAARCAVVGAVGLVLTAEVAAVVRPRSDLLATALLVVVVAVAASTSLQRFADPLELEELRPLVARVAEEIEPGDTVFVSAIAEAAFDYYAAREHLEPAEVVVGSTDPDEISAQVQALEGRARVWVVVAAWWRSPEDIDRGVTDAFDRAGARVAGLHDTEAAVFLYDVD